MKSLNDILWNKDGEIGEKEKNNEYEPMGQGQPTLLTDNCGCAYGYGDNPIWGGFSKGDRWC